MLGNRPRARCSRPCVQLTSIRVFSKLGWLINGGIYIYISDCCCSFLHFTLWLLNWCRVVEHLFISGVCRTSSQGTLQYFIPFSCQVNVLSFGESHKETKFYWDSTAVCYSQYSVYLTKFNSDPLIMLINVNDHLHCYLLFIIALFEMLFKKYSIVSSVFVSLVQLQLRFWGIKSEKCYPVIFKHA